MSTRRVFIASMVGMGVLAPVAPGVAASGRNDRHLRGEVVLDFVRSAHTNMERTRRLLEEEPRLVRASLEWSPGDFETAVDAAAHTGSVEIVRFLLDHGAAYTVFAAAVLGHLKVVQGIVDQVPGISNARGPHGIPLIDHAMSGGAAAQPVVAYLAGRGAKSKPDPEDLPVPDELQASVVGRYRLEADDRVLEFEVASRDDGLYVLADGRPAVKLLHQGQARFALAGTPAEFACEVTERGCRRILVREGSPIGFAMRVAKSR